MSAITDFKEWFEGGDYNFEEVYNLYQSVSRVEEWGLFATTSRETKTETQFFVKNNYSDEQLLLASEKARVAFLRYIEDSKCEGLDIESWYGFQYANNKID